MKEIVLAAMRSQGRLLALDLQSRAPSMDGTALIAEESYIPDFDPQKDYTGWERGSPVKDEGQVWLLEQPYNAAHYTGRPSTLRAIWGLAHTKDPTKAKPWVDAYGTSGRYMKDECYLDEDGFVHRCLQDNTVMDAVAYPAGWEVVHLG